MSELRALERRHLNRASVESGIVVQIKTRPRHHRGLCAANLPAGPSRDGSAHTPGRAQFSSNFLDLTVVELLGKVGRNACARDELLDVNEVFGTMSGDHTGGELQLHVAGHGQQGEMLSAQSFGRRVGKMRSAWACRHPGNAQYLARRCSRRSRCPRVCRCPQLARRSLFPGAAV